ncbi:hypothetical protein [Acetobacter pomorum]|nr:hypothetical protein [Acetobacter pomorum]
MTPNFHASQMVPVGAWKSPVVYLFQQMITQVAFAPIVWRG